MFRRLREWWWNGRSCELCPQCYSGPVEYEEALMGPTAVSVSVRIAECPRCGHSWES
jgi:DNA-directed RNA polymerase subunit M/transcription elongation factor TFIIS